MLTVDFHIHTSDDPRDRICYGPAQMIDRAAELGFNALAITLHDRQFESQRLHDRARDRGIVLLPGIERTIAGKHVLLINFPRTTEDLDTFDDLARLKARSNGLVIAPHPFYPLPSSLGSLLDRNADLFDAVEWSYFWTRTTNFNRRAARWARERGKPVMGGSDSHDLRQLGRTRAQISAAPHPEAICAAVREGRVTLETEPAPAAEVASVFGGMLWRALLVGASRAAADQPTRKRRSPARLSRRPDGDARSWGSWSGPV